jgi:hypothetical protein
MDILSVYYYNINMIHMGCFLSSDIKDTKNDGQLLHENVSNFPAIQMIKKIDNTIDIDIESDSDYPPNFLRNRHGAFFITKSTDK